MAPNTSNICQIKNDRMSYAAQMHCAIIDVTAKYVSQKWGSHEPNNNNNNNNNNSNNNNNNNKKVNLQ